ncbi:MAG: FlgO family outer membrane protein, partial [Phycisphaerales bacterium]
TPEALTDLRQGTTLGRFSWDMTPDPQTGQFDNYRVSEYARAIGRRIAKQFGEAFPEGCSGTLSRYSVRVVGEYEDDDLSALRDALNNSAGVRQGSVRVRSQEQSSADQLTTLDLFATGDMLSVRSALRSAVRDQLAMTADVLDARDMSVTVRLAPLALDTRQRALAGGPTTSRNSSERATLADNYAKAGKPSIAVLINRATVDLPDTRVSTGSDATTNPVQSGDGTNIIIGDRVGLGANRIDPIVGDIIRDELTDRRAERLEQGEVDLRQIENRMIERLSSLGFNLKDAAAAQAAMRGTGALDGKQWTDREFAATLANEAKADIVVSGVARVVRTRGGGLPLTIAVTVRAVRTSDNAILAAASSQKT